MDPIIIILVICCSCCCLVLGGGGGYYYFNVLPTNNTQTTPEPSSKASASEPSSSNVSSEPSSSNVSSEPSSNSASSASAPTTPAPTTPAPTTSAPTTPAPAFPTYSQAGGNRWWGGEGGEQYVCSGAKGRNTTGGNGDFNRYCIFNNETDAKAFCSSDTSCKGYVQNKTIGNMFQATRQPVANPNVNSAYNIKILPTAPAISYLDTGPGWWASEGPNQYTCPGAKGRNTTGGNGDFNRYCLFNSQKDAQDFCSSDTSCKSVVRNTNGHSMVTRLPVPNSNANSSHFVKLVK